MKPGTAPVAGPGVLTLMVALAMALAVALAGCGPNHADAGGDGMDPVATDTARGVVAITGAEPLTFVTLRTDAGPIHLRGGVADTLRAASGVELWVAGQREEDGSLTVLRYRVRAVEGAPAADGILELDGGAAVLVTPTGDRLRYAPAPPALQRLEGQRVWISGSPGSAPERWGALEPRP